MMNSSKTLTMTLPARLAFILGAAVAILAGPSAAVAFDETVEVTAPDIHVCIQSRRRLSYVSNHPRQLYKHCSRGEVWRLGYDGCLRNVHQGGYLNAELGFSARCEDRERWRLSHAEGEFFCIENLANARGRRQSFLYDGGSGGTSLAWKCEAGEHWRFRNLPDRLAQSQMTPGCRAVVVDWTAAEIRQRRELRSQLDATVSVLRTHVEQTGLTAARGPAGWPQGKGGLADAAGTALAAHKQLVSTFVRTSAGVDAVVADTVRQVQSGHCLLAYDAKRAALEAFRRQLQRMRPHIHPISGDLSRIELELMALADMAAKLGLDEEDADDFVQLAAYAARLSAHIDGLYRHRP